MLEFIGKSILEQRKRSGWTQEELAEKLDVRNKKDCNIYIL